MAKLQDNTGDGYGLKIDSKHRAFVKSVSQLEMAAKSFSDESGYQMFIDPLTLPDVNTHNLLWFKNTSQTDYFAINKYWLGYNGGSTNHNRVCIFRQFIGATTPSANQILSGAGNLLTSSGATAELLIYQSDGSAGGMTHSSTGVQAGAVTISQGTKDFDVRGSTILGPGAVILIQVQAEEVGTVSATIEGYFLEPSEK